MMRILYVEDSPADVVLMREALRQARADHELIVAPDGEAALARMREPARPDLVLLDLNLPRKDGREVLREAKSDPDLRRMPIIVMTTSRSPQDVEFAYQNRANAYVAKPNGLEALTRVAHAINEFWGGTSMLPAA
jgi:two-component system, chemotaxis family, response regulator Rcp1